MDTAAVARNTKFSECVRELSPRGVVWLERSRSSVFSVRCQQRTPGAAVDATCASFESVDGGGRVIFHDPTFSRSCCPCEGTEGGFCSWRDCRRYLFCCVRDAGSMVPELNTLAEHSKKLSAGGAVGIRRLTDALEQRSRQVPWDNMGSDHQSASAQLQHNQRTHATLVSERLENGSGETRMDTCGFVRGGALPRVEGSVSAKWDWAFKSHLCLSPHSWGEPSRKC